MAAVGRQRLPSIYLEQFTRHRAQREERFQAEQEVAATYRKVITNTE